MFTSKDWEGKTGDREEKVVGLNLTTILTYQGDISEFFSGSNIPLLPEGVPEGEAQENSLKKY